MTLDRLARALAPYAGLLTVSTCGAPGDCEEPGDRKTATVQASAGGSVALDSSLDGRVDAALETGSDPAAPAWRCQGTISARGERATSDTSSIVPMPASARVSCTIGDGRVTTRVLGFTVPLEDLRTIARGRITAVIDVDVQSIATPAASCSAKLDVTVDVDPTRSAGGAAPGPQHVTADFARDLAVTVRLAGATRAASADRPCSFRLDGTIALDVRLDPASFREADTPTCL